MLLIKLWEENLLFEVSIDKLMFPSVLEASKNCFALNDRLKEDLDNLLNQNPSPNLIIKLFDILNAYRLLNILCWNLWEAQFNNSSAYKKFIAKYNKSDCLKSLFRNKLLNFLNNYKKQLCSSTELIEVDSLISSLKNKGESKNVRKLVKIKKNIKKNLELKNTFEKSILNNLNEKNDRDLLSENKKSFNDNAIYIFDEDELIDLLTTKSSRNVREVLYKNSNNVTSVVEKDINQLIKEYFNIAKSNGYNSILDYKLRDTNLNSKELKIQMNEGYQKNIEKLNLIIDKISFFAKEDGLNIDKIKEWDYLYYINKFNKKRKADEKINSVFFDKKSIYNYIQVVLEELFSFEVQYKVKKIKNNYYVEYIIKDNELNKKMILNIVEDENNGSYFIPMLYDNNLKSANNFMRGLISIEKSENFNIFNLKEVFHEIGHAVAFFFYRNKLDYENGKEAWEFIEVESLLMEKVMLSSDMLKYFKINNRFISPSIIEKIENYNLDDILIKSQNFIMNNIIIDLISKSYPFTYQELKDKIEDKGILKIWATPNNRLLSEGFKLYHWAEWIYPLNSQIADKLFEKYNLSKKSKIKKNIRKIYNNYFSGNIREQISKL